jgi:ClpP class serine protease
MRKIKRPTVGHNLLYEWSFTVPWQIMPESLAAMRQMAQHEDVDEDELKQVMHGPKSLALRDGRAREDSRDIVMHGPVARIAIDGPIFRYADYFTKYSGGITTESLAKNYQTAVDDPSVGAILFVIDSPGGEATGINEFAETIYQARSVKPSAAYIEGFGASAALRIGAATGLVVVDDDAWVGSIGTVLGITDPSKQIKRTIDFVSSQSPKKRADPTTPEGAAYYQQIIDDMTETFIAKIMRDRQMTRAQVLALGGGMVVGAQAVAAGLADRLGSEDQLIRALAEQAQPRPFISLPPARLPSGSPARMMENAMQIFSKEWWSNLFAAQAELEPAALAAAIEPRALAPGEALASAPLLVNSSATASSTPHPLSERMAELEAQIAEQQTQARQAQAAAFADGAVRARQAMPSERQALYDAYIQASEDDSARPLASSRVSQIEALVKSRTPHNLTVELLPTNEAGTLPSGATATTPTRERLDALEAMTPLGRATLARRHAKSA